MITANKQLREFIFVLAMLAAAIVSTGPAGAGDGYYLQMGVSGAEQLEVDRLSGDFAAAVGLSGELGKFFTENVALGGRFSYENNTAKVESQRCGLFGCFLHKETTWDTDIIEVIVNATAWIPRSTGLLVGAGAGFTRCNVGHNSIEWIESGPVFETFVGGQRTFDNEFMVFLRLGYTHRDFGVVEGRDRASSQTPPADLDFSRVYIEIGFGGHTRRGWGSSR